jgi:DNA primase
MNHVKVDFAVLKSSARLADVLERYGVKIRRSSNVQLVADCPLPSHTSKESKGSFKVNTEHNVWCCKSSSCVKNYSPALLGKMGGDMIDFVGLMENLDTLGAAKKLAEWYPQNGQKQKAPDNSSAQAVVGASQTGQSNATPVPEENKPLGFELKGITYHPYLESRGISKETALKFGIGFFPGKGSMQGRIVVPIRNEMGQVVGYAGRSIDNSEPRYKMPPGFLKSHVLYNRHAVKGETCVVVEGFFDLIRVSEAGFPCVALMGSTVSERQAALLTFKYITLLLDGDEAGKAGAIAALPLLANRYVRIVTIPGQPDSMSADEIKSALRFPSVCSI